MIDADSPTTDLRPVLSAEDQSIIELLSSSSLFEGLSGDQLHQLARIGQRREFKRNSFIFREDDEDSTVYLVLSGAVRISRQVPGMGEEALAVLRPGSAFGEMALIDGSPRSADALAHETCELFIFEGKDLEDLMFIDRVLATEILWKLVRMLTKRLRQTNDKMTFLSVTGKFE